jgi:PUA domain protein
LNNELIEELPNVIVDMGAIPYVCKGADVMSPGIVKIDGVFEEEALIIVRDVNHGKALAIGRAIVSSVDMENMPKGKAINNLHYVGDKIWAAI